MTKKSELDDGPYRRARYEYRVWGTYRDASKKLVKLASEKRDEEVTDCYLLGRDSDWNAKIRDDRLKLKRLITAKHGFEQWDSNWHNTAESTPQPYDEVFRDLGLDQHKAQALFDIELAVAGLAEGSPTRAVLVTKHRRIYTIGAMKAEVTRLEVHHVELGLDTIAIQGDNLKKLRGLLRQVGLANQPNVPIHVALEIALDGTLPT